MTRVTFKWTGDGRIRGFTVTGHAGFAEKGEDLICAGISAVTFTGLNALIEVAGFEPVYAIDAETAQVECFLPEDLPEVQFHIAQVILATVRIGFVGIAAENSEYLQVIDERGE